LNKRDCPRFKTGVQQKGLDYTGHILVADDEQVPQRLLKVSLERLGFTVTTASSGSEILRYLQEKTCDLLVLDFAMPDLNGRQVCQELRARERTRDLPIIVLTGLAGEEDQIDCLEAGANDFVTKPVPLPILAARIQTQLRLQGLRSEMQRRNTELEQWRTEHEADLEAARAIQRTIVPASAAQVPGFEMELFFRPLIQVGGDLYGWQTVSRDRTLFWLVDVTGHGVSAALYTTLVALLFAQAIARQDSPAGILRQVNRQLYGVFHGKGFIAASCLLIEKDGQVDFLGAAQPPLLIKRASGGVDSFPSTGTLLGLNPEAEWEDLPIKLEPGDQLLLYTDGLYALAGQEGQFSYTDTAQALRDSHGPALLEQVAQRLQSRAGSSFSDDVTALLLMRSRL
jgi:sigma-B regulation protein RsbU (phosphoserine phosphatase)